MSLEKDDLETDRIKTRSLMIDPNEAMLTQTEKQSEQRDSKSKTALAEAGALQLKRMPQPGSHKLNDGPEGQLIKATERTDRKERDSKSEAALAEAGDLQLKQTSQLYAEAADPGQAYAAMGMQNYGYGCLFGYNAGDLQLKRTSQLYAEAADPGQAYAAMGMQSYGYGCLFGYNPRYGAGCNGYSYNISNVYNDIYKDTYGYMIRGRGAANAYKGERRYSGSIKSWNDEKGWGFIRSPETRQVYKRDIFLYKAHKGGFGLGDSITFSVELSKGRPQARELRRADGQEKGRDDESKNDERGNIDCRNGREITSSRQSCQAHELSLVSVKDRSLPPTADKARGLSVFITSLAGEPILGIQEHLFAHDTIINKVLCDLCEPFGHLLHCDTVLESTKTLESAGVQDGATLTLVKYAPRLSTKMKYRIQNQRLQVRVLPGSNARLLRGPVSRLEIPQAAAQGDQRIPQAVAQGDQTTGKQSIRVQCTCGFGL